MIVGNILDQNELEKCLKEAKIVYHLASIADISQASSNPVETVRMNILGTALVLDACVKTNIERFIFASTVYVYSHKGGFYRASKQASETLIETYHEKFNLDYTILRYGSLYGPRAQEWNGLRHYVVQAVRDNEILFGGTGEERREYIHVTDAARLSISVLDKKFVNKCMTLTGSQILTGNELVKMIQEIVGINIQVKFSAEAKAHDHYVMTPYRFTPKRGMKMIPDTFVDIGHGILEIVEEVSEEINEQNSHTDSY